MLLTALCLASATLHAQRCPADEVTQWRPRSVKLASETSPADRAAMAPMLTAAEALARNTTYGKAHGFTVTPTWYCRGSSPGLAWTVRN